MSDAEIDTDAARIARMNEFAQRVAAGDQHATYPTLRPRDAATLILIDRSGAVPKVLLGKRHARHKFMPGKFVFPGGGVEPPDRRMPVGDAARTACRGAAAAALPSGSAGAGAGLALAAIRETYEETGLLLGRAQRSRATFPSGPWSAFARDRRPARPRARCISSPAPSPRPAGRGASMRASSPSMRARSRTGSRASPAPTPNSSSWSGCRSDKPASSTCRPSPASMLEELEARIAAGLRPRPAGAVLSACCASSFLREML